MHISFSPCLIRLDCVARAVEEHGYVSAENKGRQLRTQRIFCDDSPAKKRPFETAEVHPLVSRGSRVTRRCFRAMQSFKTDQTRRGAGINGLAENTSPPRGRLTAAAGGRGVAPSALGQRKGQRAEGCVPEGDSRVAATLAARGGRLRPAPHLQSRSSTPRAFVSLSLSLSLSESESDSDLE